MSYVHKPALQPYEHRTPMQLFDNHADNHPDREAFVLYDHTEKRSSYTFKEMQQESLFLAASFLNLGWKRGQRIILMLPNGIEFLVSYMALLRIGVTAILLPPFGMNFEEVFDLMESCKSQGIVVYTSADNPFQKNLIEFLDKLFDSTKVVWIEAQNAGISQSKYNHYDDLVNAGRLLDVNEVLKEQSQVQMDDPATVMFTSGSTGRQKGAQHANHLLVNGTIIGGVYGSGIQLKIKDEDVECRVLIDRPFYWAGCQSMGLQFCIVMGCTVVSLPPIKSVKECDIDFVLSTLQNERCTNALFLGYVIMDIINHPDISKFDISSLKSIYSTGQPLHPSVFTKLRSMLPNCTFFKSYGQTEILLIAYQVLAPGDESVDDAMNLLPGNEMKIVNEENHIVPIGQVGQICIRSPISNSFLGYINNAEAYAKVVSRTGWIHTSDMGFIDQNGKLTISGRNADMIKRATIKIFPAEVEKVLVKYPDVNDVIVVGVPEERLYEELCACVIPKENSLLESDSAAFEEWMARQWTVDEMGLSMKPKYLLIMKEFPKKGTGKTDRKAVKTRALQELQLRYME